MKEFLRPLKTKDFDGLNFFRNDEGDFEVNGFSYKEFGEKQEGSVMGDMYEIIIFSEEPPKMPERFKAILISPLDYISRMMDDGFLGMVAKATTTSENFMNNVEEQLNKRVAKYIEIYNEEIDDDE